MTYPIKSKTVVFSKFVKWKALAEKFLGLEVKRLCSDNSGWYKYKGFENYLKKEEIRYEFTVPTTPEQKGMAERTNRTLTEITRCLLTDLKMPAEFCAEAFATPTYLRNR